MPDLQKLSDDDLRVGDVERRAVDERLQRAVGEGQLTLGEYDERVAGVWAARTRGELGAFVRDLPGGRPPTDSPALGARRAVAVLSQDRAHGPVAPGQPVEAYAVLGSATVDLGRADLPDVVEVRAVSVLGDVVVLVPPGADVQLTGAAVLGERSTTLSPPLPNAPTVHVNALAVLGTVTVRSADVPVGLPALRQRVSPVPVRRRRRTGRLAAAALAGVLAIGTVGTVAAVAGGDDAPSIGDRTIVVQPGQTRIVAPFGVGDLEVVLPPGTRADVSQVRGVGELECEDACTRPGRPVTIVSDRVGDIEITTADPDEDDD